MKKIVSLITLLAIITSCMTSDTEAQSAKNEVLTAINQMAQFASHTLLDENGKSRCDYNMTEGKWYDYEPPWHTGQIIYALTRAYQVTKDSKYLETATKAGDWWVSLEITDHPKLKGMLGAIHGDSAGDIIVFATVSDGSAGLFRLQKLTGDKKYARIATQAGDWMWENMYVPEDRVFYDSVDPVSGEVIKENSPFWPDKKNQTLYDVARPNNEGSLYNDMYEFTGDEKYKKLFIDLCESLVEKQDEYGLWMDFTPNHKSEGSIHPRFNLWYAESLLEGYDLTGDKRYLEAAKKTALMFQKLQKSNGTIYYRNYVDGRSDRSSICGSAVAFAGIIWLRLLDYGVGEEFRQNIELSKNWLIKNRFARDHPDKNIAGAVINTRTRNKKGKIWITNRDVGTSFGIRYLCDYYEYFYRDKK